MAKYLVLAFGGGRRPEMSPAEMQGVIEKYRNWSASLAQAGRLHDGNKLTNDAGKAVRRRGDQLAVTDGPYAESKEVLGGYWLIEAKSYDEAVKLVADSPHLAYGGGMELREIEVMD